MSDAGGSQASNGSGNHGHKPELTFCLDFQTMRCHRASCKFLHVTKEEQANFERTGLLPTRLNYGGGPMGGSMGGGSMSSTLPRPGRQICRDFLNGVCKRGRDSCRFSHEEQDIPICGDNLTGKCKMERCKYRHIDPRKEEMNQRRRRYDDDYEPDLKRRRRYDDDDDDDRRRGRGGLREMLEDENDLLKRKVAELKKQVKDLTAVNEVLLDQNARYRVKMSSSVLNQQSDTPSVRVDSWN